MNKEFVVDVGENEITIALLEDKKLVELHKEQRNARFSVGDIYLGRVKKIMPGLNAAFVDIGYSKDAFLHYSDLGVQFLTFNKWVKELVKRHNFDFSKTKLEKELDKNGHIEDVLTVGQPVLVQIAKEPISTKGPRITAEISVAHRNLVLLPFSNKFSVSSKIRGDEEKKRLRNLLTSIMPRHYGIIIRTAGEGKKVAVLDSELQAAVDHWKSYMQKVKTAEPPCLIANEISRTTSILRDFPMSDVNSVYINDKDVFNDIKEYMASIAPDKEQVVKFYNSRQPVMEHFDLIKSVKSGFGRMVSVKNGIYLVIDHTEALHVIDVNSGVRAGKGMDDHEKVAMEVNMAAAEEIARQLRLRDMGGIIVVDFIDLHSHENRKELYERMIDLMKNDRSKHKILPLTKFGLMQITRHRVRPEVSIRTTEQCPCCNGTGKVNPSLLFDRQLEAQIAYFCGKQKRKRITIYLHPYVAAYLRKGLISQIMKWRIKYRCRLKIIASQECTYLEHRFCDKNGEELV